MHYLGGVLDILMKAPPNPKDRSHHVRIAFGAGCDPSTWRLFEDRFGVEVREVYGLTEGSGFSTLNKTGKIGSIGKPYPFFEVQILGPENRLLGEGKVGEIIVRGKTSGLITQGYLDDAKATSKALRNGWLHTGDLGYFDEDGDYFFSGRIKESIRRRGENISAWEVERVLNLHPSIEESAVIGVEADIGEQEIKAFIKCAEGSTIALKDFVLWCRSNMPTYQIPRYVAFVEVFEKTPTERIRKRKLAATTTGCWDLVHVKPIVGRGR
jgi:crotonobetaine/carnitine-CoA ligase